MISASVEMEIMFSSFLLISLIGLRTKREHIRKITNKGIY
jgi:hypothetical protein